MASTKRILAVRQVRPPVTAVATVLLGLGQAAAQPASEPPDLREAPGFHDTLQAADELATALSTANEKLEALVGKTKAALSVRQSHEEELAGRVVALGEEVRQSEAEIAGLSLALEASEQRRRQLEQVGEELAQMKDELLGLRHLLKTANAALAQVQAERDAAHAETEALRAEVATLLNTALASLQQKKRSIDQPPTAGLAPGGNPGEAPIASSPETQDRREAGL